MIRQRIEKITHHINYKFLVRKRLAKCFKRLETQARKEALKNRTLREDAEKKVLADLEKHGYAILPPNWIDSELQDKIGATLPLRRESAPTKLGSKKQFFKNLVLPGDMEETSHLAKFGTPERVIAVISHYLGLVPRVTKIELLESFHVDSDGWKISQRWHRDWDDTRMVKLFTYFTDVKTDEDGPFTLLPADCEGISSLPIFPIHKTDASMEMVDAENKAIKIYGNKGSSFLVDTHRCYHRGSRMAPDHTRVALITTYTSHVTNLAYKPKIQSKENLVFQGNPGELKSSLT